jgi:hypothetical protein
MFNNSNFNVGGRTGGANIEESKRGIANAMDFDFGAVSQMNSEALNKLYKNTKIKPEIYGKTGKTDKNTARKQAKKLLKLHKKNEAKKKGLEQAQKEIMKKEKKKNNSSESESDMKKNIKSSKSTHDVKNKKISRSNKSVDIDVDSSAYATKKFYSKYALGFDTNIEKVYSLEIRDFVLKHFINKSDGNLEILFDDRTLPLSLDKEQYRNIAELVNTISSHLKNNLTIKINSSGFVKLSSINGEKFQLDMAKSPLLKFFGFTSDKYKNKSEYKSENPHIGVQNSLAKKYSLYIQDDITNKPLMTIDENGKVKYNKIEFDEPKSIELLELRFCDENNNSVDFNESPHIFKLVFGF